MLNRKTACAGSFFLRNALALAGWAAVATQFVSPTVHAFARSTAPGQPSTGAVPPNNDGSDENGHDAWTLLRAADLNLATVMFRLVTANAGLCDRQIPATGLVVLSAEEFPANLRPAFTAEFPTTAPLVIEAIVPDSPAARAGLSPGQGITAINGTVLTVVKSDRHGSPALRNEAIALIERDRPDSAVTVTLADRPHETPRKIIPVPACRAHAEILTDNGMVARSDRSLIQLSANYLSRFSADALPVIIAHELAHIVLHHSEILTAGHRLGAISVAQGKATPSQLDAENEADALSVHLLCNAGYDPIAVPRFWQTEGRDIAGGIFRNPNHASASERARRTAAEISRTQCQPAKTTPSR